MQSREKHFYEFGLFRIDTRERQLFRDCAPVSLTPKLFDLLLVLVENKGHTLGKDELMQRVWKGTFVEENNLSRNISMLRKVLGDDLRESRLIKTVPKRGYRFEPDVHEFLEGEDTLVVEQRTRYDIAFREEIQNETESFSIPGLGSRYRVLSASLIAAVLVTSAMAWIVYRVQKNEGLRAAAVLEKQQAIRGTESVEAFELYKRGRSLWQNRSAAGLHEATLLLEQAVEKDPKFALGYAALADAYAFDTGKWKIAEETANKAIELDPDLGEPYASIGFVKLFWEWNPGEAELYFKKSIALRPEYATAHQWYAIHLAINARYNPALAEVNRALELEPDSVAANADLCQILYFLQRFDDAETQCKKTLEMDPDFFSAHLHLYDIYTAKGMYDEAVEEFFKSERLTANYSTLPENLERLKASYDLGGIGGFWQARLEMMGKPVPSGGYLVARYQARLGQKDQALFSLRRAYEKRDFNFAFFLAEPVFRHCCLTDPRYQELRFRWLNQKD